MLNQTHAKILEERGFDIELLTNLGIRSSSQPTTSVIEIPYYDGESEVDVKFRSISGEKRFWRKKDAPLVFYNINAIRDESLAGSPLIITEGELDTWAAIQAGFGRVVSVPNGTPEKAAGSENGARFRYLEAAAAALAGTKEIVLAVDNDPPGISLLNDLALRLGRVRCKWVKYPRACKDLADALQNFGVRGVVETINRAQWFEIDGLYRMGDLPPLPASKPYDSGFPGLREHWRLREGDLSVITGVPSSGKTTVVNVIASLIASNHGWVVGFASFEQTPQRDHRRFLRTWFSGKLVVHQTPEELDRADAWINRQFLFVAPGDEDEPTLEWVLERLSMAVVRYGAKLVIIDPWNELSHERPDGMSMTDYIGYALRALKRFARKHMVHVIVVAHPMKMRRLDNGKYPVPSMYEISDSSHWYNRCDAGVVVFRKEPDLTIIRIAKSRYHDEIGRPGDVTVRFVRERATFEPAEE